MWIYLTLLLHVVLLSSIYVIYFQSTVISGLAPQAELATGGLRAPANRLVVFITDGLRAESFFAHHCNHVPHLRSIFLQQGLVGISRTRAPTESRPAHVALFAGFYEDPASVISGWHSNAVEFDTLFNRSRHSYAWGPKSLLNSFKQLQLRFAHELSNVPPYKMDAWVLDAVHNFLKNQAQQLLNDTAAVYFVHLVGLDVAFHNATLMEQLQHSLNYTERGIWQLYQHFEQFFPDQRTAYVLTADHGMTHSGSHGGASKQELETPLLMWGAGVSNISTSMARTFVANDEQLRLPLETVDQIQLTPLMAALLGLPPPVNSRGIIPTGLLAVSRSYETRALLTNAQQLLAQARQLLQRHERGLFSHLIPACSLTLNSMQDFAKLSDKLWQLKRYLALQERSLAIMSHALDCIDYYQNYYVNALLAATSSSILGWLCHLSCRLLQQPRQGANSLQPMAAAILRIASLLLLLFLLLQRVPCLTACYLMLPAIVWSLVLRERTKTLFSASSFQLIAPIMLALSLLVSFFYRRSISVPYFCFACCNNWRAFVKRAPEFYLWLLLVCGLTIMPWLPPSLGVCHRTLVVASLALTFIRPFACGQIHSVRALLCNGGITLVALINIGYHPYPHLTHILSWLFLFYAFSSIMRQRNAMLKTRADLIFFNLSTLYALFCTSFEALVIQLLVFELQLSLQFKFQSSVTSNQQRTMAMYALLYCFYSLFAIGDLKALEIYHTYLEFCAFGFHSSIINVVVICIRLLLPILLMLCMLRSICDAAWQQHLQILNWLCLMCNIMALICLFLVKNQGSWWQMDIGITHFAIAEVLPFLILLLSSCASRLLPKRQAMELPKWKVSDM